MFNKTKGYSITEVCDVINKSRKTYRKLYPSLLRLWVSTGKLQGRRQEGSKWLCGGDDLNKHLLPFLGIEGDTTTPATVADTSK